MPSRVSDETIDSVIRYKPFEVDPVWLDLRDARSAIARITDERDSFATDARDLGSDLLQARATIATLRREAEAKLTAAETAGFIRGRDAAASQARKYSTSCEPYSASTIADEICALQPSTSADAAAEPADNFGAHLESALGTIGEREVGVGHVVLSEDRYAWLMRRAGLVVSGQSSEPRP